MTVTFDLKRTRDLVKAHCLVEEIDKEEFARRVSARAGIEPPVTANTVDTWLTGVRSLRFEVAVAVADEMGYSLADAFPRLDSNHLAVRGPEQVA